MKEKMKLLKDINKDSRPSPSKRLCPDSDGDESTIEVEISLLQSIDKRLAKLEIWYVMREELGKLRASLEYSRIDDLIENGGAKTLSANC